MSALTTRWSRRFVLAGIGWLCLWQVATILGTSRSVIVTLALYGFVFHVVFGKAYALVPAYVNSSLAFERAPVFQFPCTVLGTVALTLDGLGRPGSFGTILASRMPAVEIDFAALGGGLWLLGVIVFVATMGVTVGRPISRGETGTGSHNVHRQSLDRFVNRFIPVVLLYLLIGAYETAALRIDPVPSLLSVGPATTHLLAVGTATLLVFTLGFRLLPRFFGTNPTRRSAAVVLPAAAIGPGLLALGFLDVRWLLSGAVCMLVAFGGYGVVVGQIALHGSRRRVGLAGVVAGAAFGIGGVISGTVLAVDRFAQYQLLSVPLAETHLTVLLLGFLGLTIVGVSFQFYPPRIGAFPGASNQLALASIGAIAGGLLIEFTVVMVSILVAGVPPLPVVNIAVSTGQWLAFVGVGGYTYLIVSTLSTG